MSEKGAPGDSSNSSIAWFSGMASWYISAYIVSKFTRQQKSLISMNLKPTNLSFPWGQLSSKIARLMWPTWDPPGVDRTQVGPMLTGLKLENCYFFTFTFSWPEVGKLFHIYFFTFFFISSWKMIPYLLFYFFSNWSWKVITYLLIYLF